MRHVGLVLLFTLVAGCDRDSGDAVASLREEVARQGEALAALQRRVEELESGAGRTGGAKTPTPSVASPLSVPPPPDEPPAVVPQCEAGRCTISRSEFEELVTKPEILAQSGRAVPALKDGQTVGFKLFGIRPNSVFDLLGLKNGDTVQEIAGIKLTSTEKVLTALDMAKRLERVALKGVRKGDEAIEIVVELRKE